MGEEFTMGDEGVSRNQMVAQWLNDTEAPKDCNRYRIEQKKTWDTENFDFWRSVVVKQTWPVAVVSWSCRCYWNCWSSVTLLSRLVVAVRVSHKSRGGARVRRKLLLYRRKISFTNRLMSHLVSSSLSYQWLLDISKFRHSTMWSRWDEGCAVTKKLNFRIQNSNYSWNSHRSSGDFYSLTEYRVSCLFHRYSIRKEFQWRY